MVYLGNGNASLSASSGLHPTNGHGNNHNSNGHIPSASAASVSDRHDSSSADDDEREGQIRVGKDYQVQTPPFIQPQQRRPEQCPERALLVWSPSPSISNVKLDEYISVSKEKFGYNAEQALGMLFWHKHDLDRAMQDLANFTPFPDEWSVEDKVLFEQAFQFHGKSFHRIRQMLPDKTIAQLVKYYYSWKKTRTRTSLMDRQARKLQAQREEQGSFGDASAVEAAATSDTEEKETAAKPKCFNCGILCHVTHSTPKGRMCGTCQQYYSRTGHVRPTTGPVRKDGSKAKHSIFKNNSQPPKGMYVNHDDLVALATGPQTQAEALLKSMDREIVSYKRNVQANKQILSGLSPSRHARAAAAVAPYRLPDSNATVNAKWTQDELLLGVQGVSKFGKDFKKIAAILGTKTESHVCSFFVHYRRKYNLDAALKEYESVHGPSQDNEEEGMLLAKAEEAQAKEGGAAA